MIDPVHASRPHMPGYGIAVETSGLLPWSWAEGHLGAARHCWVATRWPDGRPHLSPVWSVWLDGCLWFSCGVASRKARNLAVDPRCSVSTDDALNPVVVEGSAGPSGSGEGDRPLRRRAGREVRDDVPAGPARPALCATVRVRPLSVIALRSDDFTGSPTRWTFPP